MIIGAVCNNDVAIGCVVALNGGVMVVVVMLAILVSVGDVSSGGVSRQRQW